MYLFCCLGLFFVVVVGCLFVCLAVFCLFVNMNFVQSSQLQSEKLVNASNLQLFLVKGDFDLASRQLRNCITLKYKL